LVGLTPEQAAQAWDYAVENMPVGVTVAREAEQEFSIMATVGQVIQLSRNEIPIGPWHQPGIAAVPKPYRQKAGGQNSR
jgi:hypothetical protein